jgi:phosphohistidine phosphatase
MNLYLLRHAIAVPRGTDDVEEKDRPLTKEGKRKMKAIAEGMESLKLQFGRILSSPYKRAMETAEIVAATFNMDVEICNTLVPDGNQRALITSLVKIPEENLLLVGHEPHLSQLISLLISGNSETLIELKKGGLCKLASEHLTFGRSATLEWLLPPAQLRQIR